MTVLRYADAASVTGELGVLLIDDDRDFAEGLCDLLQPRGYRISVAHTSEEACRRLTDFDAQVALVDIRLGPQSGVDLLKELKRIRPNLLCVMVTAHADLDSTIRSLREGVFDFLRKPFEPAALFVSLDRCAQRIRLEREKTQAEEELRRIEHIVSSSTDLLAMLDENCVYLAANDAYRKAFNKTRDELVGHSAPEIFGQEFFDATIRPHAERCLAGEEVSYEDWFDFPVSGRQYMDIRYFPYINEDGQIQGFVVCGRLATERKQAEEALRESEERFRSLFENAPISYQSLNEEGNFVELNEAWCDLLGYTREEVIGRNFSEFIHPDFKEHFKANFPKFKSLGYIRGVEFEMIKKDGSRIIVTFNGKIGHHQDGSFKQTHCVLSDITDRKRAEEERRELIMKLEAQNSELERFTYTVSHDLKSPLITIKGYVGMLREDLAGVNSEPVEDDLTRISNAADKMNLLLRDLLELSRIGRLVNSPEDVSLEEVGREAIELVDGQVSEGGVQVKISSDLPTVFGDRLRLLEVFQNLIDNGVKYMGDQSQPRVEIGSRRDGSETVCYVRDNGIGIDPAYREKVFGLFDQLDPKVEGSGIGLALVKRIVELHGGRIWIESEGVGHGSTFCFTIAPRSEAGEGAPGGDCPVMPEPDPSARATQPDSGPKSKSFREA